MKIAALRWHASHGGVRVSWLAALCLVTGAFHAHAEDMDLARLWTAGALGEDSVHAIAVDANGYVYATGGFSGTVDFDPGPGVYTLTAPPSNAVDMWTAKFDTGGDLVWVRAMVGAGRDTGQAIAVDAQGNVLVVGRYQGGIDVDPGPGVQLFTGSGVFLAKLSVDGDFLWATPLPVHTVTALAVDAAGGVYLAGWFTGVAAYSGGDAAYTLRSNGGLDAFVKKISPDGKVLWARSFGGSGVDHAESLSVSTDGAIVISGYFQGRVDFDPGTHPAYLTSAGTRGLFVSAFTQDGALGWATAFDAATGAVTGSVNRGRLPASGRVHALTGGGSQVTTLNGQGKVLGVTPLGAASDLLAVDLHGRVFAAGHDMDSAFVTAVSAAPEWSWWFEPARENTSSARIHGLVVDTRGGVMAAGAYHGAVDFGPGMVRRIQDSAGASDMFIARLLPRLSWYPAILDPTLDSDGDGMTDAFEILHGFNPFDPSDGGATDTDGNGLTNAEESALADRFPVDPRDALLPRRAWHVDAAHGDDTRSALDGGGTPEHPWRTIGMATETLAGLARAHFPVTIVLEDTPNAQHPTLGPVALYAERVVLPDFVSLQGKDYRASEHTHIRPLTGGPVPVVRAGRGSHVRHVRVLPALGGHSGAVLLEVSNVSIVIHNAVLDGEGNHGSTGLTVTGEGSSATRVTECVFAALETGVLALDSGVSISDSQFEGILAGSPAAGAVVIGTGGGSGGKTPNLGAIDTLQESGFNRFRNLQDGARAVTLLGNPPAPVRAQYNDWGVYSHAAIEGLFNAPGAMLAVPFVPADQTLLEGAITGVVLNAATLKPIPPRHWTTVRLDGTNLAAIADETTGIFALPVSAPGEHALEVSAAAHGTVTIAAPVHDATRVPPAPRIFLHRLAGPGGWLVDINGDGRINAVDVQLVINAALGLAGANAFNADVNGDGTVNAVDVQLVINAALGV